MLLPRDMPLRKARPAPPLSRDVAAVQARLYAELVMSHPTLSGEVVRLRGELYGALVMVALARCQQDRRPRLRVREQLIRRSLDLACRLGELGLRDALVERALDLAVRVARQ